jgi:hypothetical protein
MGPVAKLNQLRTEWVVYAVFCAVAELTFGYYTVFDAVLRVAVTAAVAWYLIRELQQKSSLVWAFGVVGGVTGALGSAIAVLLALRHGDLDPRSLLDVASALIHVRMFRVLRDREVKQHVMSD